MNEPATWETVQNNTVDPYIGLKLCQRLQMVLINMEKVGLSLWKV